MAGEELGLLRDKIARESPWAESSIGKREIRRMSGNCQWSIDTRTRNTSYLPALRERSVVPLEKSILHPSSYAPA
uniref:Uncharacterized protein n=1 Tax=Aegilops tauschii subsp. strangulata TaxID=200361 RepID=A0A453I5K2_AEGTS